MARYLVGASTERTVFRKLWARLDQITGYPRRHSADEAIVQLGSRRGDRPLPYTESLFAGFVHDDTGPTILHGAVALGVDELPDGLLSRSITHNSTTRTLAEWISWGQANRGWEVLSELPGAEEAWTRVAPRDGEPGSTTGEPIPEGAE